MSSAICDAMAADDLPPSLCLVIVWATAVPKMTARPQKLKVMRDAAAPNVGVRVVIVVCNPWPDVDVVGNPTLPISAEQH
jgi:hypothetical protein